MRSVVAVVVVVVVIVVLWEGVGEGRVWEGGDDEVEFLRVSFLAISPLLRDGEQGDEVGQGEVGEGERGDEEERDGGWVGGAVVDEVDSDRFGVVVMAGKGDGGAELGEVGVGVETCFDAAPGVGFEPCRRGMDS